MGDPLSSTIPFYPIVEVKMIGSLSITVIIMSNFCCTRLTSHQQQIQPAIRIWELRKHGNT